MSTPVTAMERYGVANRGWISLRSGVTMLSRPIAKLIREDARMEAFADEAVASSPPNRSAAAPTGPMSRRDTSTTAILSSLSPR